MKENISALIAVRAGSKRVLNKNIRPFANKSLLEIKINSIKKVKSIKEIFVSSDDDNMLKIAKDLGATPVKRDKYFASDFVPMSEVYVHMAQNLKCKHIAYLNVTSPLLSHKTLEECIQKYKVLDKKYDSLATVNLVKEYMWLNGKAINYDPNNHPRSQDLPDIYSLNFAACILPRETMIERRNIIGDNFYKFITSQEESTDIDTMLDFKIAEFLYQNKKEK
jgi:N-acylneuraminate cytidylyltransferase